MRDPRILPYNLRLKTASRTLRRDATAAGRKLWYEFLRAVLGSLNLEVLRFTNAEVMRDFEGVCGRIRQVIEAKKT